MNQPFQKRSNSESDGHQNIGRLDSVHVGKEVSCQLAVLIVVAEVSADRDQQHRQSEQDSEGLHGFGTVIEEEEYLK